MSQQRVKSAGSVREHIIVCHIFCIVEREALEKRKKEFLEWELDFQAWSLEFEPFDPCFEVRFLIHSCSCLCWSNHNAWFSVIHEPCIDEKFSFRKRKWCFCVLQEKPCFDSEICTKFYVFVFVFMNSSSMGTQVHVFELITWNLRFWIRSYDFSIHVLYVHVFHPDFQISLFPKCGPWDPLFSNFHT